MTFEGFYCTANDSNVQQIQIVVFDVLRLKIPMACGARVVAEFMYFVSVNILHITPTRTINNLWDISLLLRVL